MCSAYARTSRDEYMKQKAVKCTTCKRLVVSFSSLLLLLLYSFSSLSMPRVIFRFKGLPVLFFYFSKKWNAVLMNYEINQNGGDIFSQVQVYLRPSVLSKLQNFQVWTNELMALYSKHSLSLLAVFLRHFSRFSTS